MTDLNVIADHALLPNESEVECSCRQAFASDAEWAAHVVERLRHHGHTIMPSVEPTPDPDCGQVWLAGTRSDGFHLTTEPGLIWDFGGNEYTVDEARSYAAAMLSAAAAASPTAQTPAETCDVPSAQFDTPSNANYPDVATERTRTRATAQEES